MILKVYNENKIINIPIKPSNKPKIETKAPFLFFTTLFNPKDIPPVKEANDKMK